MEANTSGSVTGESLINTVASGGGAPPLVTDVPHTLAPAPTPATPLVEDLFMILWEGYHECR